jgi:hypothetical protein
MNRVIAFTLVFLSFASFANAADEEAADAMITRGLELRRARKDAEALEMFRRADMLAPSPRTAGQLGLVESALAQWSVAEAHLVASLSTPQDPWVHKNHALLEQALSIARTHIGQITLSGPEGATVTIGGKTIGTLPHQAPVRVGEGNAIVTATAPGFKEFILSVPVQAGMETPLKIALDPIGVRPAEPTPAPAAAIQTPPPSSPQELHTHSSWRAWTGGTLVGVGGAAAVWGIVWIALDGHTSNGSCAANAPAGCKPVYNTKTAGWVLTGAGVATAAVGGVLLYTSKSSGTDVALGFGPTTVLLGGHF